MNDDTNENAFSIPLAAKRLGVDSFILYGLIQREKVRPKRARRGELVVLEIELDRVLKPASSANGKKETR